MTALPAPFDHMSKYDHGRRVNPCRVAFSAVLEPGELLTLKDFGARCQSVAKFHTRILATDQKARRPAQGGLANVSV